MNDTMVPLLNGSGGVQCLLIHPGKWYYTGWHSLPLGGMVSFALMWFEDIPPHSSPSFSRKERMWRPPLSHISNVFSHTSLLELCTYGLCSKYVVLQHLLLGHMCGPLCHFNLGTRGRLLCIVVILQWSCFIAGFLGLFQQTKWRPGVYFSTFSCLHPPSSNTHLGHFPCTTQ